MSSSRSWLVALPFALLAAGAGAWGYQEHRRAADLDFAQRRVELLQAENTQLHSLVADQEKSIAREGEVDQRKAIETSVAEIRELNFKHPVVYDMLSRADIKKIINEKLSAQYSDQDFKNFAAGLSALGLLEPNYPLKEKYVALLGEQIAAFYDQHQHKLFMFEDASLANTQNRIVLAHELTHALQDQNFSLLKLPLEVKNNDDLAMATSALIEGDATVLMSDYMMKNINLKTLRENLSGMFSQNMDQLQQAPRYLREMLIFPYLRGQEFCTTLLQEGGYGAISEAYKNPPVSSTQILHPEKYIAHENPIPVEWPDTTAQGKKPVDDNVLGEFGIRVLLSQWLDDATGKATAEGWRGDRYLAFDDGKALVWKTLWIDAEHAHAFRKALLGYVNKRFKDSATSLTPGDDIIFTSHAATGSIVTAKNGVTFIWAESKELSAALTEKFKEQ